MGKDYKSDNKCFVIYKDWEQLFSALNDKQAGQLMKALFAFAKSGETPQFAGALQMAFLMMSQQIERDGAKWERICERRAEAGKRGGRPKKPEDTEQEEKQEVSEESKKSKRFLKKAKKADTETDTGTDTDTDTDTEIGCGEEIAAKPQSSLTHAGADASAHTSAHARENSKSFFPPSVEEVAAYCAERKNDIDAQHFIDHYTANGWMVGKNPMRDWKAAVRRWEQNGIAAKPQKPPPNPAYSTIDLSEAEKLINSF